MRKHPHRPTETSSRLTRRKRTSTQNLLVSCPSDRNTLATPILAILATPNLFLPNTSSLIQYRDCVSRIVLDRCTDSSPTAVDILLGVRRRELVVTCRSFNRDVCSGALATILNLNKYILIVASMLSTFMAFKQKTSGALVVA